MQLPLPCVVETHKTLNKETFYKSGDIGQVGHSFMFNLRRPLGVLGVHLVSGSVCVCMVCVRVCTVCVQYGTVCVFPPVVVVRFLYRSLPLGYFESKPHWEIQIHHNSRAQ